MKTILIAASALAVSFAALPAMANSQQDQEACHSLNLQVSTAIGNASGDLDAARHERNLGQQNCSMGVYHTGAEHYRKAMDLLNNAASNTAGGQGGNKTVTDTAQ